MSSSEDQKGPGAPRTSGMPQEPEVSSPGRPVSPVVETDESGGRSAMMSLRRKGKGGKNPPPPTCGGGDGDGEGGEDEYMLRMSFLEHLEELRFRIIRALMVVGVAFCLSMWFSEKLWAIVSAPAVEALKALNFEPYLVQITPMEGFNVIWMKLPILCAIFLSSPWIFYQIWGFISPG